MRRRVGAGYGLGQDRAAGIVLSRAKAFTDIFVGGDGGGTLMAPFSLLGAPLGGTVFLLYVAFRVKTLSIYGRATVVPLASCPR